MAALIEITDLSFRYPDGKMALESISLGVSAGEKLALLGANGAGKSTLLLHLNGILEGSGKITVAGVEINRNNLGQVRALVGVVFQNPDDQLFSTTVYEDVAYGPIYAGLDPQTVIERVRAALAAVDMEGYGGRNPYHLSSGEKKRIAIASVLSMQPEILVFDEPTAGLDPRARREFLTLLAALPQTMILATHDLEMARQICSRLVILDEGRLAAEGNARDLLCDHNLLLAHGLA